MSFKIMPKGALPDWVEWLQARYRVVGPKEHATADLVYPKPEWPTG